MTETETPWYCGSLFVCLFFILYIYTDWSGRCWYLDCYFGWHDCLDYRNDSFEWVETNEDCGSDDVCLLHCICCTSHCPGAPIRLLLKKMGTLPNQMLSVGIGAK